MIDIDLDDDDVEFGVRLVEARERLAPALVAALGRDRGQEAVAESMAYAWQHRDRVFAMNNPVGYLYRVGQSRTRTMFRRRSPLFPSPQSLGLPEIEPELIASLSRLSDRQRVCVVLVHAYQWTHAEVAELLGLRRSSVQNHVERGLEHLRDSLGVARD